MRHLVARASTALALVAACVAWSAPAQADVDGFSVKVGSGPNTFTTGKGARSLTAVVSTDRDEVPEKRDGRCLKVRWMLTVRTEGISLDQVSVNRVENDGSFRVNAQVDDDTARLVDADLDPGQLCRDQTVTGRWDIAFTGPDDGSVTFEATALDVTGRELASVDHDAQVVTAVSAKPSTGPSASPSPTPEEESTETTAPADEETPSQEPAALNRTSGTPSVLGPGLIIGAVLVFLGVGLLLRLRARNRKTAGWPTEPQQLPTGFYSLPRDRHS